MKSLGIIFSNIHDKDVFELTNKRTLASVPFGGRFRLIDFVLSNMVNSEISKIGVITKMNYQSLMDHVGSGKYWDLNRKNGGLMILPPFGASGDVPQSQLYRSRFEALKNIIAFIRRSDEEYVVMSDCDNVCNFSFTDAISYHIKNNADITVIVHSKDMKNSKKKNRTAIYFDNTGRVTSAVTSDKHTGQKMIYTNMLIINRAFLLNILENADELGYTSFSRDVLVKGVAEYKIFAFEQKGFFANIDSISEYFKYSMELLNKDKRDMLFNNNGAHIYTKVRDSAPCRLEKTSVVSNSLIADGCVIEGEVNNSILFRGVKVGKGTTISNCIIFQDTVIGANCKLNCVIADKQAKINENRMLSGHETQPYFIAKNTVI